MSTLGKLFIVPNSLWKFNSNDDFIAEIRKATLEDFGVKLSEGDILVQVWAYNEESDNWSDHGVKIGQDYKRPGGFPSNLPVSLFEGLKEGDTITLNHEGEEIILTLSQRSARYSRFGGFHEVLNDLLSRYNEQNRAA